MTISELATILTGHTAREDFTLMPARDQQTLAQTMTRAISTVFTLAPDHYRRATYSPVLGPAATGTIAVTQGSRTVSITSAATATGDLTGRSIDYGEVYANDLLSKTTLLSPVTRASGTWPCTIYDDALVFERDIRRVVTNPRLHHHHQSHLSTELWQDNGAGGIQAGGLPRSWRLVHPGVVLGSRLAVILKVHPAPVELTRLLVEVEHEAPVWQAPDLQSAGRIPLPDEIANAILAPVAEGLLARTRLWARPELVQAALSSEQAALAAIELLPSVTAPVPSFIRTSPFH